MITFHEDELPLPVKPESVGSGYGSSLVTVPGTDAILASLPSGGSRSPWCLADLSSGEVRRGTSLPGDLRAAVFPSPAAVDQRPWALATFGLCRLELEPKLKVVEVVSKGIGKYQSKLIDLDDDLLGVAHHLGKTLVLVSKADGAVVKRVRVPGPDIAYPIGDGVVRILGHASGDVCDFSVAGRRIATRRKIPNARGFVRSNDKVITLTGGVQLARIADAETERRPGEPVIMSAGAEPVELGELTWLEVNGITVLDARTLQIQRSAPLRADAVEVLGVDSAGRIAVSTQSGFLLLHPDTFAQVGTYELDVPIAGATFLPGRDAVALIDEEWGVGSKLRTIRWLSSASD